MSAVTVGDRLSQLTRGWKATLLGVGAATVIEILVRTGLV
jgi:hypothetical protein